MASLPDASSLAPLPDSLAEVEMELQKTHETLIDKIQDELVCVVCGSVFIDPRILQCQHCFCLRCLYSTVSRERTSQIEVPCAYRCAAVTVTQGDIRTLPKNHYITNTCVLLRQQLVHRARLLERKLSLNAAADNEALTPSAERRGDSAALALTAAAASPVTVAAFPSQAAPATVTHTVLKKEMDAAKELYECEWCSCASPTCEVCPYCWSRICVECRGQFSDHQYLCLELHQPGRRPAEGWLPGASTATVSDTAQDAAAGQERGVTAMNRRGSAAEMGAEAAAVAQTPDQEAPFPYFITPFFVPVLVKECLMKQQGVAMRPSEIDVTAVMAVRLAVPEVEVQCQHHTTGFGFDFRIHPSFKTMEGVEVDLTMPHWAEDGGRPNATLSFLANTARLGETVLQDLRRLSTVVSNVVLELSSAAHQASVRRNKGFHMYAVHVWSLARSQCVIARDALLPHLERSRLLENMMGDLVVYHFQQTASHASPPQKHFIRDKCVAFMKAEVQLCRQLDQIMEGVDAVCRGIHTLLTRMYTVMKELAQPTAHRREENRRSQQSRLRFSTRMFHSRQQEPQASGEHESYACASTSVDETVLSPRTRVRMIRLLSRRLPRAGTVPVEVEAPLTPLPQNVADAVPDTILSDKVGEPDCSFHVQVAEHGAMTRTLTESMLSILRCFMQARVWQWSLSNTCIRECGLSEGDRRTLLAVEEELQLITDNLLHCMWASSRMTYIMEVEQDAAGPASSLDILMDAETLELLKGELECPMYDHSEVFESLKALSQLRAQFVSFSSAISIVARNPDTQQELLSMMSSVLSSTMTHQTTVLRLVAQATTSLNEYYADYLRTRQMNPTVGERPSPSEDTLLAVDVLKLLQLQSDEQLADSLAVMSKMRDHRDDDGLRGAHARQGIHCANLSAATQGGRLSDTDSAPAGGGTALRSRCPFRTDFSLRDTALSSCQAYGEALVRAAHGEPLQAGFVPEGQPQGQQSEEQASDAEVAAEAVAEMPSPSAGAPKHSTELVDRTVAEQTEEMVPEPLMSSTASSRTVDADAQRSASMLRTTTAVATPVAHDDGGRSARDDDTPYRESLFSADNNESVVALTRVSPSAADLDGIRKAAKLFGAAFQLPATTTSVGRRRLVLLPFYHGECIYKGLSTPFYVDGQTGTVHMDPRTLSATGKSQYVLEVLSSPLFFILFNATLSIFLHRQCKVGIMYK
ncbi:hypothetical protein LPMP_302010 [Leishmania panamensis]|uniref:RING-type domain-containing protein n=1 Tax=Leishmania panamensis TaxID=5679 RepID=A0A088RWL4_LEIPA